MFKAAAQAVITKSAEKKNREGLSAGSNQRQIPPGEQGAEDGDLEEDKLKKRGTSISEKPTSGKGQNAAVKDDDIQNLAIKEEDLQNLRRSLEIHGSEHSTKPTQSCRYTVKKQKSPQKKVSKTKKIVVARSAPPDAELKPIDYSGPPGPRYSAQNGQIIPHSLVGSVEDFIREAIRQNYITPEAHSAAVVQDTISGEINIKPIVREPKQKTPQIPTAINQKNALLNWQRKMADRKRQQGYISKLLQKPIDRLAMNQDANYREMQEMRQLVDRAIPAVDYGKGYRVGSEFWKQHESFGDDMTGIKMTLTKTEKGDPVEFEHVRKPPVVLQEIGLGDSAGQKTMNPSRHWKSNEYLKQRCTQLRPIMHELDPYDMDVSELQVIGKSSGKENLYSRSELPGADNYPPITIDNDDPEAKEEYDNREVEINDDPLAKYPDVVEEPVLGPSIIFDGAPAKWSGSSNAKNGEIGLISRVFFESSAGERTTSYLDVKNNGTTAIYYDWRKVTIPPSFDAVKPDTTQRFYFNTSEGMILPDETKHFPFIFKSQNPGIFTETWQMLTEPVLIGGASLQVVLKGIAVEEDANSEERQKILKELSSREAVETAQSLIDQIIRSIRTPDRSPSPVDAYITEEDLFKNKNPGSHYDYETVLELKNFYLQLFPEESREDQEWNLSLSELKDCIVAVPDETVREELLNGLSTVVSRLALKSLSPTQNQMYCAGYTIIQEMIDGICSCSMRVRGIMGLPEVIMEPILDNETSDDKKAKGGKKSTGKEDPKAKAKGGKGKDAKEKDRPKSKDPKGGKGKTAAGATPTKDAPSIERDVASKTPSSVRAAPDTLDPGTRKKYTEKMYSQVYDLVCDSIDRMVDLFDEIKIYKSL